jgi:hypothetical protein
MPHAKEPIRPDPPAHQRGRICEPREDRVSLGVVRDGAFRYADRPHAEPLCGEYLGELVSHFIVRFAGVGFAFLQRTSTGW